MTRTILLHAFLLFVLHAALIGQTVYHVNGATGDDANPGTSALPWKTIQKSMYAATPASVVQIAAGVYEEFLTMNVEGSAGNRITFMRQDTGAVIVDGGGQQGTLLSMSDIHFVRIDGLTFRNAIGNYSIGILLQGASDSVEIVNCTLHDIHFSASASDPANDTLNAQPLIVFGTDPVTPLTNMLIRNNVVRDCRTGYSEALAVNGNVEGFLIGWNVVHDISNIGIDVIGHEGTCPTPGLDQARSGKVVHNKVYRCRSEYATSAGIYADGADNVVIEKNEVFLCGSGIEVGCEAIGKTTSSIFVWNNFVYHNDTTGIVLGGYDYPSGSGKVIGSVVRSNTLFENDVFGSGFGEMYLTYSEGTVIRNNLFQMIGTPLMYVELLPAGLNLDCNMYFGPSGAAGLEVNWNGVNYTGFAAYQAGTSQDASSLFQAADFADVPASDFHLNLMSPGIDAGDPTYSVAPSEQDIDDELRIANGRIDFGADETSSSHGTNPFLSERFLLYPHPARDLVHLTGIPPEASSLMVSDLHGRVMHRMTLAETLNISSLSQGIYKIMLLDSAGDQLGATSLLIQR